MRNLVSHPVESFKQNLTGIGFPIGERAGGNSRIWGFCTSFPQLKWHSRGNRALGLFALIQRSALLCNAIALAGGLGDDQEANWIAELVSYLVTPARSDMDPLSSRQ